MRMRALRNFEYTEGSGVVATTQKVQTCRNVPRLAKTLDQTDCNFLGTITTKEPTKEVEFPA